MEPPSRNRTSAGSHPPSLCEFIQTHRTEILDAWERNIRAMPTASRLSSPRLIDHLPQLLDHIIAVMCTFSEEEEEGSSRDSPVLHALQRLDSGFDMGMVATEYSMLRDCVLALYGQRLEPPGPAEGEPPPADQAALRSVSVHEIQRFNVAIDEVIVIAMERYAKARERSLSALDRISAAALEARDIEQLLPKLLQVLLETTEAVDAVSIFLREGDELRLRASVGALEKDVAAGFSLKLGEGFVGRIGVERVPLELHSASTDPMVVSQTIKDQGLRALYGVPLLEGGELIGVAHMGSKTAHQFSEEDKLFFRAMTTRATMLLTQAQLMARERRARQEAQRAQEELQQTALFREQFLGIVGHDLRNPLNAILLSANAILLSAQASPATMKAAGRIAASAQRMGRMISELMDLTRGRLGGGIPVTRKPGDLFATFRHAVDELQAANPSRELLLEVSGDGQGEWDADRMAQVLVNLGMNAIQHSPEGTCVTFVLRGRPEQVVLEVHNEGPPISEQLLSELFQPFRRRLKPEPGVSKGQGLGLGLYIVHQIVSGHEGTVSVSSTEAAGTTFTVTLPRHPSRA